MTRELFGFDETSPGIETETDGTGRTVAHYRVMALTGSGITVSNARIRLVPRDALRSGEILALDAT